MYPQTYGLKKMVKVETIPAFLCNHSVPIIVFLMLLKGLRRRIGFNKRSLQRYKNTLNQMAEAAALYPNLWSSLDSVTFQNLRDTLDPCDHSKGKRDTRW